MDLKPMLTMTELAHQLGEPVRRVWYYARTAKTIPEPTIQRGRREFYSLDDVVRIKEAYEKCGKDLSFVNDFLHPEPQ